MTVAGNEVIGSSTERRTEPRADRPQRVAGDVMLTIAKRHRPDVTVAELLRFFADDHVHAAVLVTSDDRLLSVVERGDLMAGADPSSRAAALGRLDDRVVSADTPLPTVMSSLSAAGRRRLAVVDPDQRLLGLVCLKRRGDGFCSDADVRDRADGRSTGCD